MTSWWSRVVVVAFVFLGNFSNAQTNSFGGCQLPSAGAGGGAVARRYCPLQCPQCQEAGACHSPPGSLVSTAVTRVQCAPGYRLDDDQDYSLVACDRGNWIGQFPNCLAQCPPLESETVFPRCLYNGREVDCSRPMMPQTTATVECKPNHSKFPSLELEGVYRKTLSCRFDGKWSRTLPQCKPDCGLSKGSSKVQATVTLDSVDTPLGVFPWHAGIYERDGQDWKYICGGSLISRRIVLTAAHCVSSDPGNLRIALAKYYRDWNSDEKHTVKLNVSSVSVPREFSWAVSTLAWDIALILLSAPVDVNSYVMPVCQDSRLNVDPNGDYTGYVVGWGKTAADGLNSDYLLHNDVPISYQDNCARNLPKVVAVDKFCASKNSTSVVEKGDSGGGLTVIWNHQHYIIGIVSVKYNNVSVFTNVSWPTHRSWMESEINRIEDDLSKCPNGGFQCGGVCLAQSARCDGYRHCPDNSDESGCDKYNSTAIESSLAEFPGGCSLPEFPEHGRYEPALSGAGTNVPQYFLIEYSCNAGYNLSSSFAQSGCYSGRWSNPGQCVESKTNEEPAEETPQEGHNFFDADLLKSISALERGNFVFSARSVKLALSLLLEAADDETRIGLRYALRLNNDRNSAVTLFNTLQDINGKGVGTAVGVFASENMKPYGQYSRSLKSLGVDLSYVNQQSGSFSMVNNWTTYHTQGNVGSVVNPANIGNETDAMLTSAVYFDLHWKRDFPLQDTSMKCFYVKKKCLAVPMISKTDRLLYKVDEGRHRISLHVLMIPYEDTRFSLILVMPFERDDIATLSYTADRLSFPALVSAVKPHKVTLTMPKFSVKHTTVLDGSLKELGLLSLFKGSAEGSLPGMFQRRMGHATRVSHTARIQVAETSGVKSGGSARQHSSDPDMSTLPSLELVLDHPFYYFIYDSQTHSALLSGRLMSPLVNSASASASASVRGAASASASASASSSVSASGSQFSTISKVEAQSAATVFELSVK